MSYASEVLADAPALYYRMQEASGGLVDSSGNGNNTTVTANTVTYQQPSPIDTDPTAFSITWPGNARFTTPDHNTLDFGDVLTLECWFKRTAGVTKVISSKGLSTHTFGVSTGDEKIFFGQSGGTIVATSSAAVTANTWYHLACTKNGSARAIYLNGVDVTALGTNATLVSTTDVLGVGCEYDQSFIWAGSLTEMALYPTALSAARVQAHYAAAFPVPDLPIIQSRVPMPMFAVPGNDTIMKMWGGSGA